MEFVILALVVLLFFSI